MHDPDTIVIGSGPGGLTAALCLAQAGQRVLVLEQHYLPGGFCHSFTLDGHHFSPGVHYIGELGPGGRMRAIYEGLGVAQDLAFYELPRDGYDHVLADGHAPFAIPAGPERHVERLVARFPHEAAGTRRVMATFHGLSRELDRLLDADGAVGLLRALAEGRTVLRWGLSTLRSLLDAHVRDPHLRLVLSIQGGDHGLPPSRAPAAMHAAIVGHYTSGAWYPKGGGGAIPRAFIRALRRAGGEIRMRAPVARILTEGTGSRARAVGVRLADGTELRARHVVSNADPRTTLGSLVGPAHLGALTRARLAATRWSISCASLYLAVDMDLEALGYGPGNYWYNRTTDLEETYRLAADPRVLELPELPGLFLTITTLKDPSRPRRGGLHTLEVFGFVPWEPFAPYAGTSEDARPAAYQAIKERLTRAMLRTAEHIIPGVSDHVAFAALGTPLTVMHYVPTHRAAIYGTEKSRLQIGPFAFSTRSPVRGLSLCGASTTGHGVMGATLSGMAAAAAILGCRPAELLRERGQTVTVLDRATPAERPAA